MSVRIPQSLLEKARSRGIDVEDLLVRALSRILDLDPTEEAEARLEVAENLIGEARSLLKRGDALQASEKLYKAAEEALKAAASILDLRDVLDRVEARGRWIVADLERTARALDRRIPGARSWWDAANYLHVWGFHEAKLDVDSVSARLGDVEKLVGSVKRLLKEASREAGRHPRPGR